MISLTLATLLALSPGDAAAPAPPVASVAPMPQPAEVMEIPPELRVEFRHRVVDRDLPPLLRLERLVAFMFDQDGLGMTYRHDATLTVEQAYRTREANCLTFTLLTIALAREAGLEASAQEISDTLSWYEEAGTLYLSNHVNAGIGIRRQRYTIDVASDNVLRMQPPRAVPDSRLLSIYYNNRAAELLAAGDLREAERHAGMALAQDPGYASAWNNAGVLLWRDGDIANAERHFAQTLELDPKHGSAMLNLASLYARTGEDARAAQMHERIEKARQRDPFHHFMLAAACEKAADFPCALEHYRRAIRLYDGEHRFYFGLARVLLHLGRAHEAGKALHRAHAVSDGATRGRYQAKLDLLRRQGIP